MTNYLRRETVEPPRWLGTLLSADWKRALMTGLLVIWLMPGDIIVKFCELRIDGVLRSSA